MINLSSGTKKDMLIVIFSNSLFKIGRKNLTGVIKIEDSKHFTSIEKEVSKFQDVLSKVLNISLAVKDSLYMQNKLTTKISPLLHKIGNLEIEINSFAVYLVYLNFLDNRTTKLDEIFSPIKELENSIFLILDYISESIGKDPDEMYVLASECVRYLKT